jgi:hypothetical protein
VRIDMSALALQWWSSCKKNGPTNTVSAWLLFVLEVTVGPLITNPRDVGQQDGFVQVSAYHQHCSSLRQAAFRSLVNRRILMIR